MSQFGCIPDQAELIEISVYKKNELNELKISHIIKKYEEYIKSDVDSIEFYKIRIEHLKDLVAKLKTLNQEEEGGLL